MQEDVAVASAHGHQEDVDFQQQPEGTAGTENFAKNDTRQVTNKMKDMNKNLSELMKDTKSETINADSETSRCGRVPKTGTDFQQKWIRFKSGASTRGS